MPAQQPLHWPRMLQKHHTVFRNTRQASSTDRKACALLPALNPKGVPDGAGITPEGNDLSPTPDGTVWAVLMLGLLVSFYIGSL